MNDEPLIVHRSSFNSGVPVKLVPDGTDPRRVVPESDLDVLTLAEILRNDAWYGLEVLETNPEVTHSGEGHFVVKDGEMIVYDDIWVVLEDDDRTIECHSCGLTEEFSRVLPERQERARRQKREREGR